MVWYGIDWFGLAVNPNVAGLLDVAWEWGKFTKFSWRNSHLKKVQADTAPPALLGFNHSFFFGRDKYNGYWKIITIWNTVHILIKSWLNNDIILFSISKYFSYYNHFIKQIQERQKSWRFFESGRQSSQNPNKNRFLWS